MPRPFAQTFMALFRKLPFADTTRTRLRAFAEAVRRSLAVDAIGWAASFDGIDDYITVADDATLDIVNEISYSLWIYWRNSGADVDFVFSKGPDWYELHTAAGGVTANSLRFIPRVNVWIDTAVNTFMPNGWRHVVCTWDDATRVGCVYINGVNVGVKTWDLGGVLTPNANAFQIGRRVGGMFPFKGEVDELAVWQKELTLAEVTELYNAGAGRYHDAEEVASGVGYAYELRALWHFDEGTGITAYDATANGNDGTLMLGATWAAGVLSIPACFRTVADRVYDATFITRARNLELDAWGALLVDPATGLPMERLAGETDPAYRTRLLAAFYVANNALTIQAITAVVDALGATYVPAIATVRIHEHYKPYYGGTPQQFGRRADGLTAGDECLGDSWGLAHLDYLTLSVEINRIPTLTEALALAAAVNVVKAANVRALIVRDMGMPLPPRYRAYARAYSVGAYRRDWDDELYRVLLGSGVADAYDVIGDAIWGYTGTTLFGDSALIATPAAPHLCLPRNVDLDDNPVVERPNAYVEANVLIASGGGAPAAGFALRYRSATGDFYQLGFRDNAGTYEYIIRRWNAGGAAWIVIKNWTVAAGAPNPAVAHDFKVWLEGRYLTFAIDGVYSETAYDLGVDITGPGRWGFICWQIGNDLTVDSWRYW
jgi:hypothetical protein